MRVPVWVAETARMFWKKAGGESTGFPRRLASIIARTRIPLSVMELPRLSIESITRWLRNSSITCTLDTPERTLRACLFCRQGWGIAFIEAHDSEVERQFSLAHELAHFLRDYLEPRQQIEKRIGRPSLAVLDGEREAERGEKIHALIGSVPLRPYVHFLERDTEGRHVSRKVARSEEDADRVAYELLAPAGHVAVRNASLDLADLALVLERDYALPRWHAERYAEHLKPKEQPADPLIVLWQSSR